MSGVSRPSLIKSSNGTTQLSIVCSAGVIKPEGELWPGRDDMKSMTSPRRSVVICTRFFTGYAGAGSVAVAGSASGKAPNR